MNTDFLLKWENELRSGKYEQGQGYLSKDGKYCCLGVLCEMLVSEGLLEKFEEKDSIKYGRAKDDKMLPAEALNLVGISGFGRFDSTKLSEEIRYLTKEHEYLDNLNDIVKLNFKQIADVIDNITSNDAWLVYSMRS